ncbi:MAG: hypothetical protein KDA28_14400, partial [Phycisphaerales bacterium]|nr:hypothetical protein [Phycisphaerales bacterium]
MAKKTTRRRTKKTTTRAATRKTTGKKAARRKTPRKKAARTAASRRGRPAARLSGASFEQIEQAYRAHLEARRDDLLAELRAIEEKLG